MIKNTKKVAILLATYNSEKYLSEQLDSIFAQTFQDWIIFIHDDESRDSTLSIIKNYVKLYPGEICLLQDTEVGLGAYKSFVEMLSVVDSHYYMFCDHDDVWLKDKIKLSFDAIVEQELKSPDLPIIVHADMHVTDSKLNIINDSFWQSMKLLPDCVGFLDLVFCNSVNGCTMIFNKAAKSVSLANVEYCSMHDMLVVRSVAANKGVIYPIKKALVLYRQHESNVVGAYKIDKRYYCQKLKSFGKVIRNIYHSWANANKIKKTSLFSFYLKKIVITIKRYIL